MGPDNQTGYSGYIFNPETGDYASRLRYYSPTIGRFLENDPAGYVDGMNHYEYVSSMAIGRTDPMGLQGGPPQKDNDKGKQKKNKKESKWDVMPFTLDDLDRIQRRCKGDIPAASLTSELGYKNRQKLENFFADIDGWFKVMDDALKMATCMAECMVLDGEYGKAVIIALLNGYLDKLSGPFEWELEDGKNGIELKMKPKADWLAEAIKNGGIKFTGKAEQIGEDLRKIGEIHDCNARKKIGSALEETSKNLQKAMRVAGPKIVSLLKTASKANVLAEGVAGIVEGACKSSAKCEEECNEKLNKK